MNKKIRKIVIEAIVKCSGTATCADVSRVSGLSLDDANTALLTVASDTGATMVVYESGVVGYKFPANFEAHYLYKGVKRLIESTVTAVGRAVWFILKTLFGVFLIAGVVIVVVLVFIAIAALSSSSDSNSGSGSSSSDFDFGDVGNIFVFWGDSAGSSSSGSYANYDSEEGSFLEACFSFLFGDGIPNRDVEQRKSQMIASLIVRNRYALVAEQLAPYTGAKPADEDAVIPVLAKFGGIPYVTDTGNLVYRFPSLTEAYSDQSEDIPDMLRERLWQFSRFSGGTLFLVAFLAAVVFGGSLFLVSQIPNVALLSHVAALIYALLAYGAFFIAFPIVRLAVITLLNVPIRKRNRQRASAASIIASPDQDLRLKLAQRAGLQQQIVGLDEQAIEYRTDQDALTQEFDRLQ
jgi:hypothetical protein